MTLKPTDDNILVLPDLPPTMSKGGIILPDSARAKTRPCTGTVMAVGPGRWQQAILQHRMLRARDVGTYTMSRARVTIGRLPVQVEPGDRVIFPMYAGVWVEIDGRQMQLLPERDLLAVVGAGTDVKFAQ